MGGFHTYVFCEPIEPSNVFAQGTESFLILVERVGSLLRGFGEQEQHAEVLLALFSPIPLFGKCGKDLFRRVGHVVDTDAYSIVDGVGDSRSNGDQTWFTDPLCTKGP